LSGFVLRSEQNARIKKTLVSARQAGFRIFRQFTSPRRMYILSEGTMPLRILLVHRHSLVLHALKALVEGHGFQVAGQSDRAGAGSMAESVGPDVAIVDFDLPSANGLDTAREILRVSPSTKVIILSSHIQEFYITEALRLGVSGYVLTTRTADELLRCIEEVSRTAAGRTDRESDVS
jgi:DNA-binding NarL/FixJ family response regulator